MRDFIVIVVVAALIVMAMAFARGSEGFDGALLHTEDNSPYYTTQFAAYPGKEMVYSSARDSYCLQEHQDYQGYRNCMLYAE
jgi:hypothetical protein